MHDLEAVAHEIVQVEILGYREALVGHVEHLDPVQDEHPHLIPEMAVADEVDRPVVKPDLVRVHLPEGFFFPVEGVVNHLHPAAFHGCGVTWFRISLNWP